MPQTTAINTELLTTYLIKRFIPTLENELQFAKFATKAIVPDSSGVTARWNRFDNFTVDTTRLDEGTTTEHATTVTTTGAEATIREYGQHTILTKLLDVAAQSGTRQGIADRFAYAAALAMDTMLRDGDDSSGGSAGSGDGAIDTTVDFYATTATNGGSATAATPQGGSAACLIGAAKLLRDNNVAGFRGVSGHPEGHYAAIVSPKFELDMVTEDSATNSRFVWADAVTNVAGALGQEKWVNGYMGSVYGTAVYRTQNVTNTTVTVSCDNNFVLGADGLGCLSFGDADPNIFINTASAQDVGNPYRNRHTIAWHMFFATDLIDANRVVRVYSAA